MSGGTWNYIQYNLDEVIDDIERIINKNGVKRNKNDIERWMLDNEGNPYPECECYYNYSKEVIREFDKAVTLIKKAQKYIHRIDWLLSGDDGEKEFLERLDEDIR